METTTDAVATPVEPGTNDATTEGTVTQAVQTEAPKTFTQAELDTIIKSRLAEKERTLKTKYEKDLEAQIAATRDEAQKDLDRLVEERVTAREAERKLADTRAAIQAQYELSEEQVARLQGTTPEELQADAATIFGSLKKLPTPPTLLTGNGAGGPESPLDIAHMTPAEIRANRNKLLASARIP